MNLFDQMLTDSVTQPIPTIRKTILRNPESDELLLDRITDIWNAWADRHGSPKVICLTAQRGIKCRRRIQDLMRLGHTTPDDAFKFLLTKADESFFVLGNPSRPLAFDQLLTEGFMIKMIEDTYKHTGRTQWRR